MRDGLAEGRIDIHIENWRKMLPVAVAMGLIKAEVAPTVENMMALMAEQSGDGTVLDLPLGDESRADEPWAVAAWCLRPRMIARAAGLAAVSAPLRGGGIEMHVVFVVAV